MNKSNLQLVLAALLIAATIAIVVIARERETRRRFTDLELRLETLEYKGRPHE